MLRLGALTGLTRLDLYRNDLTSVPTEIGTLTGLTWLDLGGNQLTGFPTEFRTWGPAGFCNLYNNGPDFTCANVGADTNCCTEENCGRAPTLRCYSE